MKDQKTSFKDITGQKFGMLEVIGMIKKGTLYHAECQCQCGNKVIRMPTNLRRSRMANCGCIPRARKPPLTNLVGQTFGF